MKIKCIVASPGEANGLGSATASRRPAVYLTKQLTTDAVYEAHEMGAKAIVSMSGGVCSHGASIARLLQIVCVIVENSVLSDLENRYLGIDGVSGYVEVYDGA